MTAVVQNVLDLISQHQHLAGLLAFACAAAESIAIVGTLWPGSSILVGIGALVGMGRLELWPILAWSIGGAIVGDGVSFWLGHRYRGRIRQIWPFSRRPALLARGETFFLRHGGKSVLIGRFMPVMRASVPLIAGVMGMAPVRFYVANVLSALAWAPAHILPGVVLGAALESLGAVSGRLVALVAGLLVGSLVAVWLVRLAVAASLRWIGALQVRASAWAHRRGGRLGRAAEHLVAPDHADLRLLLLLNGALAGALIGSVALLHAVVAHDTVLNFNVAFGQLVQSLRTPWTDSLMVVVSGLGDIPVTTLVALAAVLWLVAWRDYRLALGIAVALGAATCFVLAAAALRSGPPPVEIVGGINTYSLPSGHTTLAAVLYGTLGWIAVRRLPASRMRPLLAFMVLLVASIAASRIYLGAHWPVDVVAGLLFAAGAVGLFALVFRRLEATGRRDTGLFAVCALTLAVAGAGHVAATYRRDADRYAARPVPVTVMDMPWRGGGWQALPTHRIDVGGTTEEPLILQWNGAPQSLEAALATAGWRVPPPWSAATLDGFATGDTAAGRLPVLPVFHNGRAPVLTMLRSAPGVGRYVLRAWPEMVKGSDGVLSTILVGSIVAETIEHPLGQLSLPVRDEKVVCSGQAWLVGLPNAQPVGPSQPSRDGGCGGQVILAGP